MNAADLPVVILCGGLGTRLAEETEVRPKPMVEIGDRPILWHILKHYLHHGFREFYLALGYKGEHIKRFFLDYASTAGDVTLVGGTVHPHAPVREPWTLHLVDTGLNSMTGGRVLRLKGRLDRSTFMLTYGDGVSNVDLRALLAFHRAQGRLATVTAVRPPARFGGLTFDGDLVAEFTEKPQIGEGWINGGFMIFEPGVFEFLADDQTVLETHVLEPLAARRELAAYRHADFWQCMDTLRDKRTLEQLWQTQRAPWKTWEA